MKRNKFKIYKANGACEEFSKIKLFNSLKRSGLSDRESRNITRKVTAEIGEGFKTRDIYRKTHKIITQISPKAAIHYSLKRAIFELGPSGHPFENFVAKYFEANGYTTRTCVSIRGKLVTHEVDIEGIKISEKIYVECKFHNRLGIKNDIKVALYVKARMDDLKEGPQGKNLSHFYVASNTAFSEDAIVYAAGSGFTLLGMNAPKDKPFIEEIKSLGLYPITSLKNLSKKMRVQLIVKNIILARELYEKRDMLKRMGVSDIDIQNLMTEIEMLNGRIS